MIIDCNTSLGHWPFRHVAHSDAAGLLSLMDRHGVEQAWVGAFEGLFYRDSGEANRMLLQALAGHEDRLRPWAAINPAFPGWEDDLSEALDAGVLGLRLYPNYHGYELNSEALARLLEALEETPLPLALYHRFQDERLHHWRCPVPPVEMALQPLLERFPRQRWLLCGCSVLHADALREVLPAHPIYFEISRIEGIEGVRLLGEKVGWERVVLGSHAPYFYMAAAHLKLVEAGLSEVERVAVTERNALALLG